VVVHAFAMLREAEERGNNNVDDDPFITSGLAYTSSDSGHEGVSTNDWHVSNGKEFREELKVAWFTHKRRAIRRNLRLNQGISFASSGSVDSE
jgi:hypothetical protein